MKKLKMQVGPKSEPIKGDVLNFDEVMERMDHFMDWLAKRYVTALNIIHYMHDKLQLRSLSDGAARP